MARKKKASKTLAVPEDTGALSAGASPLLDSPSASPSTAQEDACGGGCCGSENPVKATEEAAPPSSGSRCGSGESSSSPPPSVVAAEDACETGCCGSEKLAKTTEEAAPPSSGSCCDSGETTASPSPSVVEKPPAADACDTGCCGSSDVKPSPPAPSPVTAGCCSNGQDADGVVDACCASSPPKPKSSSCCAPKAILVAPAKEVTSCCSSSGACSSASAPKATSCKAPASPATAMSERVKAYKTDREAARLKSPISLRAVSVESLRLSIGGMTCSGCCTRIEGFAREQPGILSVNVSLLTSRGVFEYDPTALSAEAVEKLVTTLGFTASPMPDESLAAIVLHIGRESPQRAKQLLLQIDGVAAVRDQPPTTSSIDPATAGQNSVLVEYDPDVLGARALVSRLSKAMGGVRVLVSTPRPHAVVSEEQEVAAFARYLRWSCLLALPVVFVQYVVPLLGADVQAAVAGEVTHGLSWSNLVGLLFATPILCIVAYPIHESAYLALRFGSRVTMDVLISLSSISAYVFSVVAIALAMVAVAPAPAVVTTQDPLALTDSPPPPAVAATPPPQTFFEVTAILLTLILLGRYIEKLVKVRASHSVDALLQLQAKTAILVVDGKETYVDVLLVERGDVLKVLPGARIPTDGVVVDGASAVDESMVTGESRKVAKQAGSTVIGGTLNAHGVLAMRVTHTLPESMLARIVALVDDAQSAKCASQSVADVVASYFTTFIVTVAVAMFVVWYELASRGHVALPAGVAPLPFALQFAITVLVISCPCAISLAVPTVILVASTVGAKSGVLFKGGQAIEALDSVDVIMFDKTGTLTTGALHVVDFLVAAPRSAVAQAANPQATARQLWTLLAAAEHGSEHAIARAVREYAAKVHTPSLRATQFEAIAGCGVRCVVGGQTVCVGSLKWMLDVLRVDVPLDLAARNQAYQRDGCVVVCLAVDNVLCALVALQDAPRREAQFVVDALRRHHKMQTWIVTGDQLETARGVAAQLGVPEVTVIADVLPHQKVDKVRLLQSIGKRVAFVGDGVNDAPALAMADVGIALGAGTDVALEAADVVLVKDDLRDLLNALALARAANRLIKWNFTWAFAYNVVMMPLACGALYPLVGWAIPPALAGLSELLSSVPVILFSLLLNLWTPPFGRENGEEADNGDVVAIDMSHASETTPLLVKGV